MLSCSVTDVEAILLPEGIAGLWRRLASGEPVTAEGAHRRKDGTAFPVEIRVALLGEVAGRRLALSIARDITGREAPRGEASPQDQGERQGPLRRIRSLRALPKPGARAYMMG